MVMGAWLNPDTPLWKRRTGPGGNHGDHCGLDREEASRTYARWTNLDNMFQPGVPPTDDFGGPMGKGVPSATAEARPFL